MANVTTLTDSNGVTKDICDQTARDSISQRIGNASSFDLNDMKETGLYYCLSSSTNMPTSNGSGGLVVIAFSSAIVVQLFVANTSSPGAYARRCATSWSAWQQL